MSDSRTRFLTRLRAARRGKIVAVIAVVVAVPLAVAAFFVGALGGSADRVDAIPAMVVNDDTMIPADDPGGMPMFAGRQLVTELTGENAAGFRWTVSNASDALKALKDGEAYAVLTIPEDFSQTVLSLSTGQPSQAQLALRTDDAHSYLAGSAAQSVGDAMARSFGTEITSHYLSAFYENLGGMGGSLSTAADGATELSTGTSGLSQGLSSLADGAESSAQGAQQLASGVREYTRGVDGLSGGLAALDEQTGSLGQLGQGVASYVGGTQRLAAELAKANAQLQAADPADPVAIGTAKATVDYLAKQLSTATAQGSTLAQGAASLGGVHDGIAQLNAGASKLSAGSAGLRGGADSLAGGLDSLATGAQQSATGAHELDSGASQFAHGLQQGAQQTQALADATSSAEKRADVVANPIAVDVQRDNPVASVAQAIGVVAVPIALWIGAIAVFLILRPVSAQALASTASSTRLVFRGLARASGLALVQAVPLVALLHLAGGVAWSALPATLAFSVLLALVFTAVHFALTALFGRFGIVLSLLVLTLQLATVPGLLPSQMVAGPFQFVTSVLPLGHAINGMQAVVAGSGGAAGVAAAVLLVWGAVALLAAFWRVSRQRSARALRALPA